MKKIFTLLLFLSIIGLTGCSKDDSERPIISNSKWVAKIESNEISVAEQYREKGYWVLKFTDKEYSISISQDNYTVYTWSKGTYQAVSDKEFVGTDSQTGEKFFKFYLEDNNSIIYCPYLGKNLVKQE